MMAFFKGTILNLFKYINVTSIKRVLTQIALLSDAISFFGSKTGLKLYTDSANNAASVARTIRDIIDGQPVRGIATFIQMITENKTKYKDLKVEILDDGTIKVQYKNEYIEYKNGLVFESGQNDK